MLRSLGGICACLDGEEAVRLLFLPDAVEEDGQVVVEVDRVQVHLRHILPAHVGYLMMRIIVSLHMWARAACGTRATE